MRTRLAELIDRLGISQADFAKRHDLPRVDVSMWCRAKRRPGLLHAMAIERASGGEIPAEYWLTVVAENRNGRMRRKAKRRGRSASARG